MEKLKKFFQELFIPHEKNNYKGKALQLDFLTLYLIFAFFISIFFKKYNINILGFATDITINKLFELTNKERQKYHLPSLNYNEKLAQAAYLKAQDMFNKNYWAHFAPDGTTPWEFILKSGYNYEYAGENLAKNFLFSDDVIAAWMRSPTHKKNILKEEYTDVGFAVVNGILNGEETTLVVQMFGKPSSSSIVANTNNNQENLLNQKILNEEKRPIVLAETAKKNNNYSNIIFNTNFVFFVFLLIALMIDIYFIAKLEIVRISGKTLAHFIFILFIIISFIIISKGSII